MSGPIICMHHRRDSEEVAHTRPPPMQLIWKAVLIHDSRAGERLISSRRGCPIRLGGIGRTNLSGVWLEGMGYETETSGIHTVRVIIGAKK